MTVTFPVILPRLNPARLQRHADNERRTRSESEGTVVRLTRTQEDKNTEEEKNSNCFQNLCLKILLSVPISFLSFSLFFFLWLFLFPLFSTVNNYLPRRTNCPRYCAKSATCSTSQAAEPHGLPAAGTR